MTFDSTIGGASATSYISVADADAFADVDVGSERDAWVTADDASKERALQRATVEVDNHLLPEVVGYSDSQALLFPRVTDVDSDGDPIVPMNVRRATYHQAAYVLRNARVIDAANVRQYGGGADDFATGQATSESDGPSLMSPRALMYLRRFQSSSGGATLRSAIVGTDYSYPRVGMRESELVP